MAMKFSIRHFRAFDDWVDFDESPVTVLTGPNSSGKSGLVKAFLLLREQRDIFRLSFAGGEHGISSFLDAVSGRDANKTIDLRISCSVDAASVMAPENSAALVPVPYDFELALSYASDEFDGGASGILVDASIEAVAGSDRVPLFSARRDSEGYDLALGVEEALRFPFVHDRTVGTDAEIEDTMVGIDRALERTTAIERTTRGWRREKARALLESLRESKRSAVMNRELRRIVLPEPREIAASPVRPRFADCYVRLDSPERKYLRSIADMLVAEALGECGLRSMRSRETGREIRLSFYSLFYDLLSAAGFAGAPRPAAYFPARASSSGADRSASRTSELVREAQGEYGAMLRDAVNFAAARRKDGSCSLEGARFAASYGESVIAFREEIGEGAGKSLVPEGGALDPEVLDLESRHEEVRSALAALGIGEDLEFPLSGSEERAIWIDTGGRRLPIGDFGDGPRRLVLLVSALLYLPWGSLVIIEDPESGLDHDLQEGFADLASRLARRCGARCVIETRSARVIRALASRQAAEDLERMSLVVLLCGVDGERRRVRAMRPDGSGRFTFEEESLLYGPS